MPGLYDGPHATPKPSAEGPVFLGIGNITEDGHLDLSTIRHIAEEDFPKWTRRVEPRPGDIVFVYEAALNRYAIIPEGFRGCLGRRLALIRPDPEKALGRFLFYYFFSEDWRRTIGKNTLSGATVDRIPLTTFPTFELGLPSLETQEKITAILSPYDDLIENNTRRIAILEEMARSLYREWFVNFRFPGHEQVCMVDSPLGEIPKGWKIGTINDLVDVNSGVAFKSKTFVDRGDYGLVTIKNVKDGSFIAECESQINDLPPNMPAYCHVETGDILLSLTGNVGRACLVHGDGYLLNQRVSKLLPNEGVGKGFVYFTFRQEDMRQRLEMISTGVAQQNLSPIKMGNMEYVLPPRKVLSAFSNYADVLIETIVSLNMRNRNLRQTRDILLPKLISGELDVSDLDIDTGELSA